MRKQLGTRIHRTTIDPVRSQDIAIEITIQRFGRIDPMTTTTALDHEPHPLLPFNPHENCADLDDIVHFERSFYSRRNPAAVNESPVGAVQILNNDLGVFVNYHRMLPRRPDPVGRFLIIQVDINWFVRGPANNILPFVQDILLVDFQALEYK
jgi:hypothetical protein